MADLDSGRVRSINLCQSLQNIIISKNQHSKLMNNACKLKNDYGKVCEKCDSVLPILGVYGPVLDCNRLLAMSGMYWNACCALKRPLTMISDFKFLWKKCNFVMAS